MSPMPTKAQLEKAEALKEPEIIEDLISEIQEEEMITVYVSHIGAPARSEKYTDEKGQVQTRHVIDASVNSQKITIECDKQQQVPKAFEDVFKAVMDHQQTGQ